ncbi:putative transmembrane GTPase FZO-like [Diplonema papillatum]|nr:putative transmembrane GTPase FZO-like [Diplonema papillatum]
MEAEALLPALLHAKIEDNVREIRRRMVAVSAAMRGVDFGQVEAKLDALAEFYIVVAGEWNRGKSSLVNALLGERAQVVGNDITTQGVTVLRYSTEASVVKSALSVTRGIANPWLKQVAACLVDTPGCNSLEPDHQRATTAFLPQADVLLLVLSSDQPLTASERALAIRVRKLGKKVVYIVNKSDYKEPAELNDIERALKARLQAEDIDPAPTIFVVSCKQANAAAGQQCPHPAQTGDPPAKGAERGDRRSVDGLRLYLQEALSHADRIAVKLSSLVTCFRESLAAEVSACEELEVRLAPAVRAKVENDLTASRTADELAAEKQLVGASVASAISEGRSRAVDLISDATAATHAARLVFPARLRDELAETESAPFSHLGEVLAASDKRVASALHAFQDQTRSRIIQSVDLPLTGTRDFSDRFELPYSDLVPATVEAQSCKNLLTPRVPRMVEDISREARTSFKYPVTATARLLASGCGLAAGLQVVGMFPAAAASCFTTAALVPMALKRSVVAAYRLKTKAVLAEADARCAAIWADAVDAAADRFKVRLTPFNDALHRQLDKTAQRKRYLQDTCAEVDVQREEAASKLRKLSHSYC